MSEHTSEKEQNENQKELLSHGATAQQAKPKPKEEISDLPEFDELNEEEQEEIGKMTSYITRQVMESYSGPLPHPNIMAGYEKVLPGTAERIVAMAEKEQAHRHNAQNKMIQIESRDSACGMILAFCLSIICLLLSVFIICKVPNGAGAFASAFLGASGIISVIITFIKSTRQRSNRTDDDTQDDDE